MNSRLRPARGGFFASVVLILLLAGCASDAPDRRGRPEPLPTLSGQQNFFDDRITVAVTIGAMNRPPRPEGQSGGSEARAERRRPPGGFGGGMGGGMAGGMNRPPRGDGEPQPGARAAGGLRQAGPPVVIQLRFTNHGTEPVELRVADFLSPLGNFVVQPEVIVIAPGATVDAEPLASSLARQSAGGDLTLKLRLGERVESRTIPLEVETAPRPGSGKTGQAL